MPEIEWDTEKNNRLKQWWNKLHPTKIAEQFECETHAVVEQARRLELPPIAKRPEQLPVTLAASANEDSGRMYFDPETGALTTTESYY